jgi:lipopolysaccharide/colanic/teichoic acid biosynthesis glycosyltransferase
MGSGGRLSRWRRARRKRSFDADRAAQLDALDPVDRAIIERSLPHTMTGVARLQSVIDAVRYCERRQIPGVFAECGVWRGGSVLAMILTLQDIGSGERDIYLFDTFEGMTEPGERDVSRFDGRALERWRESDQGSWPDAFKPEIFNQQEVRQTLAATAYPATRLMFVKGRVEETIPAHAPERIALLRLDTDWYESTRHAGRHGEAFEMLKFRSMVDGAERQRDDLVHLNEADGVFKIADDPRITRVGRVIRRLHIDEIPQLVNVVRGDMSLVGPRPLPLDEDRRIEGWHRRRLDLRPGITGPWQVLGSSRIPISEMVQLDYQYVANLSLWNDIRILLLTVPQIARRRGL